MDTLTTIIDLWCSNCCNPGNAPLHVQLSGGVGTVMRKAEVTEWKCLSQNRREDVVESPSLPLGRKGQRYEGKLPHCRFKSCPQPLGYPASLRR